MEEPFKRLVSMKKVISILTTAICVMACNKAEVPSVGNTLSAVASINTQTKTVFKDNGVGSGMEVKWAESESFKAYYSNSEYLTFNKKGETTFDATDVPDGVSSSTEFFGVYGEKASYNGGLTIDFSNQDGTLAGLGKYDIMTCTSTTEANVLSFEFKHRCAILRMSVRDYMESGSKNDKIQLNIYDAKIADGITATGFFVNTYPANITYNMTDLSKLEWNTVYKANGNVDYKETTVYLAVPPMDYIQTVDQTGGFSNKTFSKTIYLKSTKKIEAGKIYDLQIHNSGYPTEW